MPHQTTEKPEDIIKAYLEKTTQKSLTKSTSEKSPKSVKIYPKVRLYRSLTQHTSLKNLNFVNANNHGNRHLIHA